MSVFANILVAATLACASPDTTALVNFGVLDMDAGEVRSGLTVWVEQGRVLDVAPSGRAPLPEWVRRIDGGGRTLVPGLVDAHVHMDSTDLPLFLANGVTAIRDLNGSPERLRWRDAVAQGKLMGPRMLVSTPILAGEPQRVRYQRVTDPDEAKALIRRFAAEGYDYVKIYDGLRPEVYAALTETTHEVGLPLTGHIPASVHLAGVLEAGQGLEHAEKIVFDALGHTLADPDKIEAAADDIARAGVPVTPTLAVQEVLNAQQDPDFAKRFDAPELAYVDSATLAWWSSLGQGGRPPMMVEGQPWPVRFMEAQRRLVRDLSSRGVPLMAGTDEPNPLMVPGFSLHDELDALVRAGLTPLQALRAATVVPGRELPFDPRVGRIEPGYAADFIAVDGDPLDGLEKLRHLWGVMTAGRWLGRADLDRLLMESRRRRDR